MVAARRHEEKGQREDPDAELMLRAQRGDRQAFEELFRRHASAMVRFAARYVGDEARAEELAQEIFLRLHRSLPRYAPTARFKTFLYRIAANHCLNELRRPESRRGAFEPLPAEGPEREGMQPTRPDEMLEGKELEAAVNRALGCLPERERMALVLCRFQGLSYREIAAVLEASEAAIKSLVHRATVALSRGLGELSAIAPEDDA